MNDVPIGTEMVIKKTKQKGVLKEIIQFPTTFVVQLNDNKTEKCYTYEVDIKGWPPHE